MADKILKENATSGIPDQSLESGISLTEIEVHGLWSIQASRDHDLDSFAQAVFAETMRPGEMLGNDSLRLICLWPHKAYLQSTDTSLPEPLHDFTSMVTDISHGFCELSLTCNNPLEFLNSYTSVDLTDAGNPTGRNLRCLLGQYQIILFWDDASDIRILVDRSYTGSFCDYLDILYRRWSATSIC